MGQVFLARDNKLGRRVAIKFLAAKSRKLTDRFLVEARATARCSHENIVIIHAVDEHAGVPYMVLEYVEGATLSQLARDRRMAPGRVVELIVPVVRALAAAHAANIVHRDLKP
ncbi:MAG TPA: protein kinase, partial [Kofleriaceae bacterium]|nr:protein kinase [Kofleriaceae bacterium]